MKLIWRTLQDVLPLLPAKARRFLGFYVVATSALALLDIAALGLLAITLAAMVDTDGSGIPLPLVGEIQRDSVVWVLAAISLLIVLKGVVAVALQWVATRRFAVYELEIGDQLFDAYIRAPWTERLKRNTAQLVRLADVGIANATSGFLLPVSTLPSLVTTFLAVLTMLIIVQPLTAGITLLYLGVIAGTLYFGVSKRALIAGRVNRDYSFRVASLMTEMVGALKEITLRGQAPEVARVVHSNRLHTTRARSNLSFLGGLPRYVLEAALVGGFLLIGAVTYATGGEAAAISAVAFFGVAGFRMVPALTAFQAVVTQTASTIPHVRAVINDITASKSYIENAERVGKDPIAEQPLSLDLRGVQFTYPGSSTPAVTGVDLSLPMGSSLALVGSSGSGKTTLVDILLGLLVPSEGEIELDGEPLENVLAAWRSRVGYVPQDVSLFDASVAQNVALTWTEDYDRERVRDALRRAQLLDVIEAREGGLDARIGDRGMALSGGQRQRIGIARALYVDPLVLVMDEATSALDTKTESDVSQAIAELAGEITVISVAHRLSTIRTSQQVCFMKDGRIVARGTFDELVAAVPEFAAQAALAGLAGEVGGGIL
ncbi:ABC transporter ATP-binding protein [Sanguibacter inulinus]|uniref:ABC transporter ATP-binding protein n=1 Tax=Sanguibacter inulinus TaxID=60922 RepID=A0A853ETJ2_9MICO|nr:ABC transporter ATP-binding protein [Sanguibacter inulinus]MBF0722770.1 ABC transporter ATP-binding protein [Sanguibacter inulinus]NYS93915.1 ABC transporter ATP-binding protein [Sanguibacter inulinus]